MAVASYRLGELEVSLRSLSCSAQARMAHRDLFEPTVSIYTGKVRNAYIPLPFEGTKDLDNVKTAILKHYEFDDEVHPGSSAMIPIRSAIMTIKDRLRDGFCGPGLEVSRCQLRTSIFWNCSTVTYQ